MVRRLLEEVWNGRNVDAIDSFYHPEVAEEIREHHRQFLTAFPDMHTTVEELIGEGDLVAARLVIEGTHRGPFAGLAPTGRQVSFVSHRFYRLREGKVVETLGMQDRLGLQQQLGALPAGSPGAATAHPRPAADSDVGDVRPGTSSLHGGDRLHAVERRARPRRSPVVRADRRGIGLPLPDDLVDAGFDHVFLHQVGPRQEEFLGFAKDELLPKIALSLTGTSPGLPATALAVRVRVLND